MAAINRLDELLLSSQPYLELVLRQQESMERQVQGELEFRARQAQFAWEQQRAMAQSGRDAIFGLVCGASSGLGELESYCCTTAQPSDFKGKGRKSRKKLKAEAKAHELIKDLIGLEQWKAYRRVMRIIVKPGEFFWMIGDVLGGKYNKFFPFGGNPEVVRMDDPDKLYITSFCVAAASGEEMPYTDKVFAFLMHLVHDEVGFVKTVNRIGEGKLNRMKECAVFEEV